MPRKNEVVFAQWTDEEGQPWQAVRWQGTPDDKLIIDLKIDPSLRPSDEDCREWSFSPIGKMDAWAWAIYIIFGLLMLGSCVWLLIGIHRTYGG